MVVVRAVEEEAGEIQVRPVVVGEQGTNLYYNFADKVFFSNTRHTHSCCRYCCYCCCCVGVKGESY